MSLYSISYVRRFVHCCSLSSDFAGTSHFQCKRVSMAGSIAYAFFRSVWLIAEGGIPGDIFSSKNPADYAPYILTCRTLDMKSVYVLRLMSSVSLWNCIATPILQWAANNRENGIHTFEMLRTLRECWIQATNSTEGVSNIQARVCPHISHGSLVYWKAI